MSLQQCADSRTSKDDRDIPTISPSLSFAFAPRLSSSLSDIHAPRYRRVATFTKPDQTLNGFCVVIIGTKIHYEGLLKDGRRYGPGVYTFLDSLCQNIGWWQDDRIVRLCLCVCPYWVPKISAPPPQTRDSSAPSRRKSYANMRHILVDMKSCYSGTSTINEAGIDWASLDLEQMIASKHRAAFVKRCHSVTFDPALVPQKKLMQIANSDTMQTLCMFTCEHLHEGTSYSFNSLIHNARHEFGKSSTLERASTEFLMSCSCGNKKYFKQLAATFAIHPNICDGQGNNGVIYAVSRDKLTILRELCLFGADFTLVNDEGLNALSIVLLRFIALLRNIKNWNYAFSSPNTNKKLKVKMKEEVSQGTIPFDVTFSHQDKRLLSFEERKRMTVEQIFIVYGLNHPSPTSLQDFQPIYTNTNSMLRVSSKDSYVFHFTLKSMEKTKSHKHKSSCFTRKIENDTFVRLNVVFNTLVTLLHFGCDPNRTAFPLPPLFLALFTENRDVVKMLLKFGADPRTRYGNYYDITVLHALASMRSGKYLIDIAKVLLSNDAVELDARTHENHWFEARRWIVGRYTEMLDIGKTPLHIIALRNDRVEDSWVINQLARLLMSKGATPSKRYLGHVPLTLAMLRGNAQLVKTFLKCGASANEEIGTKMGNPICVYLLHRYKNQLPALYVCRKIVLLLFKYGADTLKPIGHHGNVFEFLQCEAKPPRRRLKRGYKKFACPAKMSLIQMKVSEILVRRTRRRVLQHYESLIFMALFLAVQNGVEDEKHLGFRFNLSRLMKFDHVVRVARLLVYCGVLQLDSPLDCDSLRKLFRFLRRCGIKTNEKFRKHCDVVKLLRSFKPVGAGVVPELDMDHEKYKVCFTCCQKTGKILLACPSCGFVHFCSRRCETYSRKHKLHLCSKRFYSDELTQYKFCEDHQLVFEGVHDEFFNNIRTILDNLIISSRKTNKGC